jgi:putative transcriptional regulator
MEAWQLALESVKIDPFPAERIKSIRKSAAKSTAEFEERFGIPAATMNNWEQSRRKPDPAGRLLLRVNEKAPGIVEQVVHKAAWHDCANTKS